MAAEQLITRHLDLWTAAIKRRSTAGRGSSSKVELYGIKKLRELILELAVRGLLVPQDPKDEPASELLKRITAEKAKLVKAGKIKKEKLLPPIGKAEEPFAPPNGWTFFRLSQVAVIRGGCTPSMAKSAFWGGDIPWVSPKDMHGGLVTDSELKVTNKALDESSLELIPVGSILIVGRSGILKRKLPAQITGVPCTINQDLKALTPVAPMFDRYLQLTLLGNQTSILKLNVKQGTTVQSLVYETLFSRPFALPPLAEQHRIVAKVDELMTLCDQLEQQTDASLSAHQTLVETLLLNALTSAADHAQFSSSWQRISEHFDTLFTTEESIDQLKQTILQLTVMGKLVPQDPKDEPASELLKKIAAEKAKLVKEGKIKKDKSSSQISKAETPFSLPRNWEWVGLQTISLVGTGATPTRDNSAYYNPPEFSWVTSGETSQQFISETREKISAKAVAETNVTIYPPGTLIVAMYGQGKTRGQITELLIPAGTNQACAAIQLIEPASGHRAYIKIFFQKAYEDIRSLAEGGAQPNLNLGKISETVIPLPPLAEQQRIVAKVDELMALCDQLKSRLNAADQLRLKLAEAVTDAALNPPSEKIIPFPDAASHEARRHAIGCHAVAALKDQRSFGRTMLMKMIYLADTHIDAGLAMGPERAAAGPFDQWIYRFEEQAEAAGWFGHEKTQGDKIRYKPQAGLAAQAAKVHELLDANQVAELDRVLKLFTALSTEDAEIIATLFAAWNDFLIDGHMPDDAEIIREVREHWTPEKQRFSPEKLQTWLHWLRKNKLVPCGRGPRTVQQGRLFH